MSRPSRRARMLDLALLLLLGGSLYWVAANKWALIDWWALRNYQPSVEAVGLAKEAGMSHAGRQLLYVGDPKLVGPDSLRQVCGPNLIGCVTEKGQIYILQDNNGRYRDEIVTTAAHEMLHLAYRRLSRKDRHRIDRLVTESSLRFNDPILSRHSSSSHAEAADELHSILATTRLELPQDLERHYELYFTDRAKVVAAYHRSRLEPEL
jgi:hypothetical protein